MLRQKQLKIEFYLAYSSKGIQSFMAAGRKTWQQRQEVDCSLFIHTKQRMMVVCCY